MTVARYALGVAALLLVVGSLTTAAILLRRRFLADWDGALARLSEAVIGLTLLILLLEVLGAIGWFRLGPIVAGAALIALATAARYGPRPRPTSRRRPTPVTAITLVGSAAVIAAWAGPTLSSYEFGIRGFDSLWYHLPWAAAFAQTGHVTPLHFTDVEYLTAFYPASAELVHGLGIALVGRDTLSPGLNLVWLGLLLLAAYCVGRPRRLGHATLLGGAIFMASPTMILSQSGSAANDVAGVFFFIAAVALVINAEGDARAFMLAAAAAGLAVGTKLSLLGPVLALALGTLALSRRERPRMTAGLALAVTGGFWYLRNLIAVGNPLPWVRIPGLAAPAAPLQEHTAFSVAHYATDTHVWSTMLGPGLGTGLGNAWPALVLAVVTGPLLCLMPGAARKLRVLALVALCSLLAYLLTPESAAGPAGHPIGFAFNLRYAAPAATLCLTLLPLAPPLSSSVRARQLTVIVLAALLIAMLASGQLWPERQLLGAIGIGVAVLLAGAVAVYGLPRPAPAIALGLILAAAGGYFWQRRYLSHRYAFRPGVSFLAHVWDHFRDVHHARVALVGTYGGFFSYPLFGLDDSNRVQYVGRRGGHGSFTPITSCAEWRSALNRGRYEYIVTTPARDPWQPKRLTASPEAGWTASDPAARLVYGQTAQGQPIAVYALRGPLHPSSCST